MEEILKSYEDIMLDELNDLITAKKNGTMLTAEHICDGEKILKSIEHIERILMFDLIDEDSYSSSGSYNANYRTQPRYSASSYNKNRYGARRYGHDSTLRAELEKKLSMARNENERAVYSDWLMELDNRR